MTHQAHDPHPTGHVEQTEHAGHTAGDHAPSAVTAPHDKHEGHSPEMFRDRLVVSLLLTVPILYLSPQIQDWFGYEAVSFTGSAVVSPVLATLLYVYGGGPFVRGGIRELKARQPGMMTLITMAISVAYGYSMAVTFGLEGDPFFWELATLIDVMLLGHWIEMRSVQTAGKALEDLAAMVPAEAHRVVDQGTEDVPVSELIENDRIVVRPGEQVPADGEVTEGRSSMNEAFLTGESRPVLKDVGDEVVAGAINGEGALIVQVTRLGEQTTLSQIMRLVAEAQASRSRYQVLADRAAFWLTIVALSVAIPTFVVWVGVGEELTFAVARAVTVLVIACPHALGLAIPLVTVNATSIAARNGILVRNREAFERARDVRFVAFDKTGTLTEGRFAVIAVTASEVGVPAALSVAAGLERASEHPLADAIVEASLEEGAAISEATDVRAVPGHGLEGSVDGRRYRIGRPEWLTSTADGLAPVLSEAISEADRRGDSAVVLAEDSKPVAVIALADKIRASAATAVSDLKDMEITPVMITGDAHAVATTVAEELGLDRHHARVLPADKAHIVAGLRAEGRTAFVGDGINDAPALLEADLGIAIGAGTNVAIESADLVLIDDDPRGVTRVLQLARATRRKMVQNLGWATGYNAVAVPLAAGVAVSAGIVLSPAVGALLMSLSTVIVAVNAVLLRRVQLS